MIWRSIVFAAFFIGSPLVLSAPISFPATEEEIDAVIAKSHDQLPEKSIEALTDALYGLRSPVRFPDRELAGRLTFDVQERLREIPGHAEYFARRLREPWMLAIEGDMRQFSRYASMREVTFIRLGLVPSIETVRVLAGFLDDASHPHPEIYEDDSPAYGAANVLRRIIEDPPTEKLDLKTWQQWRDDVEAGKITYRLKGVGGEYNFKGPVASGSSPDRHGSRVPPGRKKVPEGESADAGTSKDGPPVTMIVIAAALLVGAVAWFVLSKRT